MHFYKGRVHTDRAAIRVAAIDADRGVLEQGCIGVVGFLAQFLRLVAGCLIGERAHEPAGRVWRGPHVQPPPALCLARIGVRLIQLLPTDNEGIDAGFHIFLRDRAHLHLMRQHIPERRRIGAKSDRQVDEFSSPLAQNRHIEIAIDHQNALIHVVERGAQK